MLNIDVRRVARSHAERVEVVQAIAAAPVGEPELDWIEWKRDLDLSSTDGAFTAARSILGFGNRHPDFAARYARGCAYFLAGVSPGELLGVTPHDPADVDQWLTPYIARGEPQWNVDYVHVGGMAIMFLAVEAPQWGDPIFTLRKGFGTVKEGAIFVRGQGKTDYASAQDVAQLTARARQSDIRLNVNVGLREPSQLCPLHMSAEVSDAWVASEAERLRRRELPRRNAFAVDMWETRDPEEYDAELGVYLSSAPQRWQMLVFKLAVEQSVARLALVIENPTDVNYPRTEVTLRLPGDIRAFFDTDRLEDELTELDPPLPWGQRTLTSMIQAPSVSPVLVEIGQIEHEGGFLTIRLPAIDVRPGSRHDLHPVFLIVPRQYAGQLFEITWRATSTGAAGDAKGTVLSPISSDVIDAGTLAV